VAAKKNPSERRVTGKPDAGRSVRGPGRNGRARSAGRHGHQIRRQNSRTILDETPVQARPFPPGLFIPFPERTDRRPHTGIIQGAKNHLLNRSNARKRYDTCAV